MSQENRQPTEGALQAAIDARGVGKCYRIYDKPQDRLKQSLWRGRKKFYHDFWALDDISFRVDKGETVGVVGSNGSGKSTLLQLICGIHPLTTGELRISGRVAALLELGAGFNPEFTGEENVRMNAAILGLSEAQIDASMDKIIAFADIGDFIKQPVKLYSSGMYVRLAFATAINVSADILVVDEALAVGDPRFRQKCMHKIRAFCKNGTVLFVSHDTEAITELCSRAIWIESGSIRMDDRPKRVVEAYLEFMYGEDSRVAATDDTHDTSAGQDLMLSDFNLIDDSIRQFGNRGVLIRAVRVACPGGANGVLHAGRPCEIAIVLHVLKPVARPLVGFIIKDRLGRTILGENSDGLGTRLPAMRTGADYRLVFRIARWPNIQAGDYSVSIAVADGTSDDHVQCHWLHDAAIFSNVHARQPIGIFSVPDTSVTCDTLAGGGGD